MLTEAMVPMPVEVEPLLSVSIFESALVSILGVIVVALFVVVVNRFIVPFNLDEAARTTFSVTTSDPSLHRTVTLSLIKLENVTDPVILNVFLTFPFQDVFVSSFCYTKTYGLYLYI